jgi:hypothetical protein
MREKLHQELRKFHNGKSYLPCVDVDIDNILQHVPTDPSLDTVLDFGRVLPPYPSMLFYGEIHAGVDGEIHGGVEIGAGVQTGPLDDHPHLTGKGEHPTRFREYVRSLPSRPMWVSGVHIQIHSPEWESVITQAAAIVYDEDGFPLGAYDDWGLSSLYPVCKERLDNIRRRLADETLPGDSLTTLQELEKYVMAQNEGVRESLLAYTYAILWGVLYANQLRHCSNIVAVQRRTPDKVAKKRAKKYGAPPTKSHTVLEYIPRKGAPSTPNLMGSGTSRTHMRPGMFCHYGNCCPGKHPPHGLLFGKHEGIFWVPPHIRGGGDPDAPEYQLNS